MLPAMPPEMRPTFAVVAASMRPSGMSAIARAAATTALRPSSGAIPACDARPMKRNRSVRWVGAAMTTFPIGAAWS